MLPVVPMKVGVHPVERIVYASTALASTVVSDEAARYLWIQDIVAKAALKLPVLNSGRDNLALLRLVDEETLIRVDSILSVKQTLPELVSILQCVGGIRCNTILPAHIPTALL